MKSSKALFHLNAIVVIFFMAIMGVGIAGSLAHAGDIKSMNAGKSGVVKYWTKERIANAIPRDLAIDQRGLGYLRKPDGSFVPYGHQIEAETPQPLVKPIGDTDPPNIDSMDPAEGAIIGESYTFSATVTDYSGIKAVTFVIVDPYGKTYSFSATNVTGDTWSASLQGFTDGNWGWWVVAEDGVKKSNIETSRVLNFTVQTGVVPPPDSDSDTISNAVWTDGGVVQTAAGRIYFEMPKTNNPNAPWQGYVCSGTVVDDGTTARSVVLTAAHCVYDDIHKAFARNVLFIPDQAETTGSGTDDVCDNDPLGCWMPSFGAVDVNWTERTFPDNIKWDYAFYVVDDNDPDAHTPGLTVTSDILDFAAGALSISFDIPDYNDGDAGKSSPDFTHALGYSYSDDPNLMYCAEDMTTEGGVDWWLPSCELSGGSSGGPWVQPMDIATGSGPIISVNSWGYTNSPGMAGPMLNGTASCIFDRAAVSPFNDPYADGEAGIAVDCP